MGAHGQRPRHRDSRPDQMKEHDMPEDDIDTELEVWDQFVTAVRWLARGPRAGLTLAMAMEEALMSWTSEQAALEHADLPFNPTTDSP